MDLKAIQNNQCTGCMACRSVCPEECIAIVPDNLGFAYPQIDNSKCIDCNACNNICPAIKQKTESQYPHVYAAISSDMDTRLMSSSGGVFTELAKSIISQGGIVFGAMYKEMKVVHEDIDTESDIPSLQGSKYTQSDIASCYTKVERHIASGKRILFVGTPCQVDGIRSCFASPLLITCAIVCHGVPSNAVFDQYVQHMGRQLGGRVSQIKFRNSENSWRQYSISVSSASGKSIDTPVSSVPYMKGFIEGYYMRDCCHDCPSKPVSADIYIGDYWGVEHYHPQIDDDRGVSVVMANDIGNALLLSCDALTLLPSEYDNAIEYNPAIYSSSKPNPKREEFVQYFVKKGYRRAAKKYLTPDTRVQYVIKKVLNRLGIIEY